VAQFSGDSADTKSKGSFLVYTGTDATSDPGL